jgi:hypothetical protein
MSVRKTERPATSNALMLLQSGLLDRDSFACACIAWSLK